MRHSGKSETARNQRGGRAGERVAHGQQQKGAGQERAQEAKRRGTDPPRGAKTQNSDSLERDEREDGVDEARIGGESDHALSACRRPGL
jgi:hypothetical protein